MFKGTARGKTQIGASGVGSDKSRWPARESEIVLCLVFGFVEIWTGF